MEDKQMGSLILMAADIASDVLLDYYYSKRNEGVTTITVEDILNDSMKYREIRKTEIAKVKARISDVGSAKQGG